MVNGSIASSSLVSVNPGGTLGGKIAPGNSIGHIVIDGDFSQNTHSEYEIDIAPDGSEDFIELNGNAAVAGLIDIIATPGIYTRGTQYTVLTATGTRTGSFSAQTVNWNSTFLQPDGGLRCQQRIS